MTDIIKLGSIYKHFKGNLYMPIDIVTNTETQEEMVIYISLKDNKKWARPVVMWDEEVVDANGNKVKRFEELKTYMKIKEQKPYDGNN